MDNTYVYSGVSGEDGGMIDLVHCYAMRNGLYGDPKEVHIVWTRLDLSEENELRQGSANDLYQLVVPTEERFRHFAVHEDDLSVFMLAVTSLEELVLKHVTGPDADGKS